MSRIALNQQQFDTLSQLLTGDSQASVSGLLQASLERLVAAWPAKAGALLYATPYGETMTFAHGPLGAGAEKRIRHVRRGFGRREAGRAPAVASHPMGDGHDLIELPLQSGRHIVGLLHLVAAGEQDGASPMDKDLLVLLVRAISGEAEKITMLRRTERDLHELQLLYEIGQALAVNLNLHSLLDDIKLRAPGVVGAERCSIFILDEAANELVLELPGEPRSYRMPADKGIAGWVVTHGVGQIVNDVEQDGRWYNAIGREAAFITRSILCVPMRLRDRTIGAMQLLNKTDGRPFSEQDQQLLTTLAAQAAIAIENARLYQSLTEEHERLLRQEAELRHAMARDLHDGPAQDIAAMAMNIGYIKKLLQTAPERVPEELDTLASRVNRTTQIIGSLLFELRPLGLEDQGLLATLQRYVDRWRDPSGAATRLRMEAPATSIPRLPPEQEAAMFIIIQEAVNNARKHARSGEITISLQVEGSDLVATVHDRGRGFDLAAIEGAYTNGASLGLLNMKERASMILADLTIRSEIGHGTTVRLSLPIR